MIRAYGLGMVTGLLAALAFTGCAEPPSSGACPSSEHPVFTFADRRGASLADGDEVDVFPPPQGGVFTELDVSIVGVSLSDLDALSVSFESTRGLGTLASVSYDGSLLPMWCGEDDVVMIDDLPVGFEDGISLPELDSEPAALRGTLDTRSGELSMRVDVILQWTDY